MRTQVINRTPFYYSLFVKADPEKDENGFYTGEKKLFYRRPVRYTKGNVSPATGNSSVEQFGTLENYDKVIVTADLNCPINENSILWIDDLNTQHAYDYIVRRVARSKNSLSIAVAKVDTDWNDRSIYPRDGLYPSTKLYPFEDTPPWVYVD